MLDHGFKSFVSNRQLISNSNIAGKLSVFDISGKLLFEQKLAEGISTSNMPYNPGVYILNFISSTGKNYSEKIILN